MVVNVELEVEQIALKGNTFLLHSSIAFLHDDLKNTL